MRSCFFLFLFLLAVNPGHTQTIAGVILDGTTNQPVTNVTVENVYTNTGITDDSFGHFIINAEPGQLISFHKLGYKTVRVRIPATAPPYYKIVMSAGAFELNEIEVRDRYRNYKADSLRNYQLYKPELDFPTMSALDMINHPFSALSKKNRRIWAFQKDYSYWEQEKFIDYAFNENLITHITGLKGDSLLRYQMNYRPSYELLRQMKEYDYYRYIRETAALFRRRFR